MLQVDVQLGVLVRIQLSNGFVELVPDVEELLELGPSNANVGRVQCDERLIGRDLSGFQRWRTGRPLDRCPEFRRQRIQPARSLQLGTMALNGVRVFKTTDCLEQVRDEVVADGLAIIRGVPNQPQGAQVIACRQSVCPRSLPRLSDGCHRRRPQAPGVPASAAGAAVPVWPALAASPARDLADPGYGGAFGPSATRTVFYAARRVPVAPRYVEYRAAHRRSGVQRSVWPGRCAAGPVRGAPALHDAGRLWGGAARWVG